MKYLTVFLLLLVSHFSLSQTLRAKVIDENNEPMVGVTVYFDGTTRGVITNIDGVFEIDIPDNGSNANLVISFLGYEAIYIKNLKQLRDVYQLQPKVENLNAVEIYKSPFDREEMMEVFMKYFIGTGRPARQSEILNPEDIILYYVVKENTLYGKSANPIVIQNDYLGYKVNFDLQSFKVNYTTESLDDDKLSESFFFGYSFFEDINPKKNKTRNKVYFRSINYFFKSLVEDKLDLTNFYVGYNGELVNPEKVFEVEPISENLFEVSLEPRVYKNPQKAFEPTKIVLTYRYEQSNILFLKPSIRVNQFGNNLDVLNIRLLGELSEHRLAKMLPNNYKPK